MRPRSPSFALRGRHVEIPAGLHDAVGVAGKNETLLVGQAQVENANG